MSLGKKIKVYMGVPSTGTVVDSQAYFLREIAELYKEHIELVYPTDCVRRIFHDFARNSIVDDFLAGDCDVLWFLDSDITPPKHILDLVAVHLDKWKVAGATYPVFMNALVGGDPEVIFTCYAKNPETGNMAIRSVPPEGIEEVDGLATGCLFIKREVFATLEKPYFEFKFEEKTRNMIEGEDLGFCRKINAQGIKVLTDFSMVCKHQKSVDLLDVNNYAISYSNRTFESYDVTIRNQIEQATAASFKKGFMEGAKAAIQKMTPPPKSDRSKIWTPPHMRK